MPEIPDEIKPPAILPKFGLTANRDLPLSLYVYVARVGGIVVPIPQAVELIFAYTEDEAMASLNQKYTPDKNATFDPKGKIPAANILQLIQTSAQGQPVTKVKTKADYYAELIIDLKKIASQQTWPDGELVLFNTVIDKLDGVVKESQLLQQL